MSQATIERARAARPPMTGTVSFADAVRAEWTKFRTIRGTVVSMLITVAVGIGYGALFGFSKVKEYENAVPADRAGFDPMQATAQAYFISMLAVAVIGVLAVTSEYASGTIRASAIAVPSRPRLIAAKAVVVGAAGVVVGQITAFGAFFLSQSVLSGRGVPSLTLGGPDVLRAVVGGGLCLALVALFGMAVAFLVRATASAITITSIVIITPATAPLYPNWLAEWIITFWPTTAGTRIVAVRPDPDLLAPWAGFGLMCLYVAAMLAIALTVFRSRDV